jgi:hypothetical protein
MTVAKKLEGSRAQFVAEIAETRSIQCCDSEAVATTAATFLNDVECVPYKDDFYIPAKLKQYQTGLVWENPITCEFPVGSFQHPRALTNGTIDDVIDSGLYQCCKTGPALQPFANTRAYRVETYSPVILYSIAAIISIIVIVGLSIPLLIQLTKGTYKRTSLRRSPTTRSNRGEEPLASSSSLRRGELRTSISSAARTRRKEEPTYSSYNLYLVYLAVPDLLYAVNMIVTNASKLNQQTSSHLSSFASNSAIIYAVATANIWLNATTIYEVMPLLRSMQNAQKINQPRLKRVNLQAAAVYLLSAITGVFTYFTEGASSSNKVIGPTYIIWLLIFGYLPVGYVLYMSVVVWRHGYLRTTYGNGTRREKAMKELGNYFFRITGVFLLIWLPTLVLGNLLHFGSEESAGWGVFVVTCTSGVQAIVTFCLILTKSDAKKYIVDLVTLSYLTCGKKETDCQPNRPSEKLNDEQGKSRQLFSSGNATKSVETDLCSNGNFDAPHIEGSEPTDVESGVPSSEPELTACQTIESSTGANMNVNVDDNDALRDVNANANQSSSSTHCTINMLGSLGFLDYNHSDDSDFESDELEKVERDENGN